LTGTEGTVDYRVDSSELSVHLHWDNPFASLPGDPGNSYDETAPAGFKLPRVGGDGDNASVVWVFNYAAKVSATFENTTGEDLHRVSDGLTAGVWTNGAEPPAEIAPGATVNWGSNSYASASGTEGTADYQLGASPLTVHVHWKDTGSGGNIFDESAPAGFPISHSEFSDDGYTPVTWNFCIVDSDGDGIPDAWETNGINVNGTVYTLPGANPNHKDIYVEADAMSQDLDGNGSLNVTNEKAIGRDMNLDGQISSATPVNEDLRPAVGALQAVVTAFANSPVTNPDGTTGVTLHFASSTSDLVDDGNLPLTTWGATNSTNPWPGFFALKSQFFGSQAERSSPNAANLLAAKALVYHYVIFALEQGATTTTTGGVTTISPDGSSGLSENPGNDLMVTLGDWGTPGGTIQQQEGTFMHEFGHNLGLGHGGGDGINNKPNYDSVMNYTWQVPQSWMSTDPNGHVVPSIWQLDYSRTAFPTLGEASLDETTGIQGTAGRFVQVGPYNNIRNVWETGPVDWNGDGSATAIGVAVDVNRLVGDTNGDGTINSADGSPGQSLAGYNDWANLDYNFRSTSAVQNGQNEPLETDELTYQTFQSLNDDTHVAVTSDLNASTYGQSVTFTASAGSFNGSPLPGGTVEFFDGGSSLGTRPVSAGGVATLSTTLLTAADHTITVHYSGSGAFQASTSPGYVQTVHRAPLSVSADSVSRAYGSPNPIFTGTILGIQNGDAVTATYTTTATPSSDVGTYPIMPILIDPNGRLSNYNVTVNNGTLTITKAHLSVTADDQTKILHGPNPPLTATIRGFVLGQTLATSGVTGAAALSTTATPASPIGTYPIAVSIGTLAAKNYDFPTFVPGKLYVTYGIRVDFDQDQAKNPNATIPVKIELVDYYGVNVSAPSIGVHALYVAPDSNPSTQLAVLSPGNSQPGNDYRFTGGGYQFNLKNTGRAAGKYRLDFAIDGDPLTHYVSFLVD
jgi:hypothetical protein